MFKRILILIGLVTSLSGCNKLLDEKSDMRLTVPSTLQDLQAILDANGIINANAPNAGEMSADDYYITTQIYGSLSAGYSRNIYLWKAENLFAENYNDWNYSYKTIYSVNSIIEVIPTIERNGSNRENWDNIKGQAHAIRGFEFLNAIVVWGKAFNEGTADGDLGIPLRLNSDFNEKSVRASVRETFNQVIRDFETAIPLLPNKAMAFSRMSKPAAYALLSRTYLYMGKYEKAKLYADSALNIHPTLLDFNTLKQDDVMSGSNAQYAKNKEIIFTKTANSSGQLLDLATHRVVQSLYDSFDQDDLRKSVFFQQNLDLTYSFKGNFTGPGPRAYKFFGVSAAEIYLTRAECFARNGNISEAMDDLNELLKNRWDNTKNFTPLTASNQTEALDIILLERRKEMIFRGLRWFDLKRLNRDGANITLTRVIDGVTYTLPPNDNRYALQIPEEIIILSGMPQNPK